ncbi:MAG: nitrogen regulation protein NR(II) [Gammaproteobacteria bacterium]|nr:nitrogen regulation protein NR(II) [Gammaproteobacteria bacterium]
MPHRHTSPPELYRHLLEHQTTVVLWFDGLLNLQFINPAGEMMFAVSARRLRGMHARELFAGAEHILHGLERALASGHGFTEREVQITFQGGKVSTLDTIVTPVNEPQLGSGLLVELMQLDRQLRITREENIIAQQSVSRALTRGLAHEIKNPLGGLRGAAQLLERELGDPALKEYTDVIIGEADRLQNLVDRMLGPNTIPKKDVISIHQILERVRQLVSVEVPTQVKLVRDYDPSIPDLTADPDQLIQAVLNIVRNAAQAVGERGEIVLRTRTLRQYTLGQQRHKLVIKVDVIDNGPGITPDMMESMFYPMVTGRPDGTGLGLSIAQAIINQHGGLIECASEPGNTRFTLLLPLQH